MELRSMIIGFSLLLISAPVGIFSQDAERDSARPVVTPTRLSPAALENISNTPDGTEVSRRAREQAYIKLLAGQRHLWKIRRSRSETIKRNEERLARAALQKAVELDPKLAEGYTALAELALIGASSNIDDAILLSEIAVRLDADNFGAHRFLGRLFTVKSNLGRGNLNTAIAEQAIVEWEQIGRLDPRNAEAWAFLSAFYDETGKKAKRIESLKNWLASATPIETSFYANVMKNDGALSPESASIKLGSALLEAGQFPEALEILTRAVADNPGNAEAVDLLGESLEKVDEKLLPMAVNALRQAVFADPNNQALVELLAETIAKSGEIDSAVRVLQDAVDKSVNKNKYSASKYQLAIGDLLAGSDRTDEAIEAYRKALTIRGIKSDGSIAVDDKDFAIRVINKMVNALRKANRAAEAERLLQDSRGLFGKNNFQIDIQQIES